MRVSWTWVCPASLTLFLLVSCASHLLFEDAKPSRPYALLLECYKTQGWEDVSVSKMLAMQALRSEFGFPSMQIKIWVFISVLGRLGSMELAGYPAKSVISRFGEKPCFQNILESDWRRHLMVTSDLHINTHKYTYICTHTQICTHIAYIRTHTQNMGTHMYTCMQCTYTQTWMHTLFTHIHIHIAHTHVHIHAHTQTCIHACTCSTHTHKHVHTYYSHTCIYTLFILMYTYMHTHKYVQTYICTCTHTLWFCACLLKWSSLPVIALRL